MNDSYRPDLTAARLERAVAALGAEGSTPATGDGSQMRRADHSLDVLASASLARRYGHSVTVGQPQETLVTRLVSTLNADPEGITAFLTQHPQSCRALVDALESVSLRDRVESNAPHLVAPFTQTVATIRASAKAGPETLA